jgi:hypothetical protein
MFKVNSVIYFVFLQIFFISISKAQSYSISGSIVDNQNNSPLVGATVALTNMNDSIVRQISMSNNTGNFVLNDLRKQSYMLKVFYVGYNKIEKRVVVNNDNENIGRIEMQATTEKINAVVVVGQLPAAVQKGDTVEMNAQAYKTTTDASAEDLVKKMPTISIDNSGTVKAQGENVKQVTVDGKPFFGDDPTVALRNLPAEVIDKVQIFNKLSDQAQLTGFDDGNTTKTMNIVTKKNSRNGTFGKAYAGYGYNEKYLSGGNINFFNGDRRISIIGLSNNINQQNFSSEDLLGLSGGTGGRGGFGGRGGGGPGSGMGGGSNNFMVGLQSGVSTTSSIGLNYSDSWGPKIKITGSYFFNNTKNTLDQYIVRQYTANQAQHYNETDSSNSRNYNNRLNFRIEFTIDTMNSLILVPKISFQSNSSQNSQFENNLTNISTQSTSLNQTNAAGYNFSNDLTYRHKFLKKGRTISLSFSNSTNNKEPNSNLKTLNIYSLANEIKSDTTEQKSDNLTNGYAVSSNLMYTEPTNDFGLVQFNYGTTYNHGNTDQLTYNLLRPNALDTALSNKYNSNYITNRGGIGYRIKATKFNASVTLNYQLADLTGSRVFPKADNINREFENWMPSAMIRYNFSEKNNLMLFYRTNTNPPSVNQLQNVINNSDPQNFTSGNPALKQEYSHSFLSRFSYANAEKSTNFFAFLSSSYTLAPIGNLTLRPIKDSIIGTGIVLKQGSFLTMPVNFDHGYNLSSLFTYGFPLHFIKCNMNINTGFNFTQSPGEINYILNRSNSYTISQGLVFSSNISENLDFTFSYTGNYSIVQNSVQPSLNNNYFNQIAGLKFTWIFWKGIVIQNDVSNQYYKGLSSTSFNQDYILWNASLGKKLFAKQQGEIKLGVFDLLNQNAAISRSVTGNYVQDTRTNTIRQYFMLTFTYTLRRFNATAQNDNNRGQPNRPPFDRPPTGNEPF